MKKNLFILLLFIFVSCGRDNLLKNFIEQPIPVDGSSEKRELNASKKDFSVEIYEEKLKIDSVRHNFFTKLKISNGILKTQDKGEWGGKIEFISDDGKTVNIKKGNVKFVFQLNNKIYFIEGLSHLGINEGQLYELEHTTNGFSYKSILKFEDAPLAMNIFENKLYIAGFKSFFVVDNFKIKNIFMNAFWSDLYPNSVAVIDETIVYLGIRSGIVKLNLQEKKMNFYKAL